MKVCAFASLIGPYVDGELSGAERLRVANHLDCCQACAREVSADTTLGDLLRSAVVDEAPVARFEGLASSVVERVRVESSVTWTARFDRATGDSRLLWVGAGSMLGAAATTLLVVFSLFVGQAPARADSLSALFSDAGREGTLMVIAHSPDGRTGAVLLAFGDARGPRVLTEAMLTGPSEHEIVDALAQAVTRQGRVVDLADMSRIDRENVEQLLAELSRRRTPDLVRVEVQQVRFVTSTDVTAKGL